MWAQDVFRLPKLKEGGSTALFLVGMVVAAGWTMARTDWAEGLDVVLWAGLGGVVAGFFLGWSVIRGAVSHFISAIYGLAWVGYLLGRRLPEGLSSGERIRQLVAHLAYWIRQAATGGEGRDTLIFVMLLSGLFWILGYNAAWNTYRRTRIWRALVPLGAMTLVGVYYYNGPAHLTVYMMLYLFFAVLYIVRSHIAEREETWRRERVAYSPDLRFSVLQAGVTAALIVLTMAWVLPSAAAMPHLAATWRRLSHPWHTVQEEWQRLFSTLHGSPVPGVLEPFGPSLSLGGPRDVQRVLLMDITAPKEGRYYWRGAVYATYTGERWDAIETESILLIPGRQPPGMEQTTLRRVVTQTITSYMPGRYMLVGASQSISVDREAEAYINLSEGAPLDFARVLSTLPLDAGEQYTVVSRVSVADATSLRQAGTDYPEWVRQHYLKLPLSLPERVTRLAEQITASAPTPYDKAVALEQYLRDHITYDLTPPEVPKGRDYVDFLLFDSQRGYCNDYASAMTVMARSIGLPARLASGYSQGEYDEERGVFRVRGTNAHTWPELYFPGYGWIEFEPTVSEAPLIRPELDEEAAVDQASRGARHDLSEEEGVLPPFGRQSDWQITPLSAGHKPVVWPWVAGLAVAASVAGGWWAVENLGFRGLRPVERAYARLLRLGQWLGRPMRVSDTPWEWARDVSALAPNAREPIDRIVTLYVRARFARGDVATPEAEAAWRSARPALWRSWLRHFGPSLRRRQA